MDPTPPWPYMLAKQAGRVLGVSTELLSGLANHISPEGEVRLRAFTMTSNRGNLMQVYNREDVKRLASQKED